jgi:hypothetical protein
MKTKAKWRPSHMLQRFGSRVVNCFEGDEKGQQDQVSGGEGHS